MNAQILLESYTDAGLTTIIARIASNDVRGQDRFCYEIRLRLTRSMSGCKLSLLCNEYDCMRYLVDGTVQAEGVIKYCHAALRTASCEIFRHLGIRCLRTADGSFSRLDRRQRAVHCCIPAFHTANSVYETFYVTKPAALKKPRTARAE